MTEPTEETPPGLLDMLSTGATYRQLDYWTRHGYLDSEGIVPENSSPGIRPRRPGSGHPRRWSERDWHLAYYMVRLVHAGFIVAVAADMAARAYDDHDWTYVTPAGVTITWKVNE